MAEASAASAEQQVKQRAMRRLAVAVGLIGLAVVGLAVLDHYSSSRQAVAPQVPDREPPAIATLPPPKPIAPAPTGGGTPADGGLPGAPQAPVASAPSTPPGEPAPPPPPSVAAEPPAPNQGPRASTREPRPAAPAPSVAEDAGAPAPAAVTVQRPTPPSTPAAAPGPGFVVQLGMFNTVANAESLRARLASLGIPVFLETRVVVGPFRDRAEAAAAQARLKSLGVSGVVADRK